MAMKGRRRRTPGHLDVRQYRPDGTYREYSNLATFNRHCPPRTGGSGWKVRAGDERDPRCRIVNARCMRNGSALATIVEGRARTGSGRDEYLVDLDERLEKEKDPKKRKALAKEALIAAKEHKWILPFARCFEMKRYLKSRVDDPNEVLVAPLPRKKREQVSLMVDAEVTSYRVNSRGVAIDGTPASFLIHANCHGTPCGSMRLQLLGINAEPRDRSAHVSDEIVRDGYGHIGIGTKMYEEAARVACKSWNLPIQAGRTVSGGGMSKSVRAFWEKQVAKGRAELTEQGRYRLNGCPAPPSLGRVGMRRRKR